MPHLINELSRRSTSPSSAIAEHWKDSGFFLYLGRHVGLPICLEGALKLKEISYIPTDAYAAGEMKHGPIALLDERTPVVCVATDSPVLDKVLSNIAEVRARGAHVIAVATEGNARGRVRRGGRRGARAPTGCSSRCSRSSRCSCWPTTSRARAGSTWTSRATWPRPSRSSSFAAVSGVGIDLSTSSASSARWSAGRGWPSGCSPTPSAAYAAARARPGRAPGRALLRQGGGGQGARA